MNKTISFLATTGTMFALTMQFCVSASETTVAQVDSERNINEEFSEDEENESLESENNLLDENRINNSEINNDELEREQLNNNELDREGLNQEDSNVDEELETEAESFEKHHSKKQRITEVETISD